MSRGLGDVYKRQLHLLGYDHMEDEERLVMEAKQKEVLDTLGITRN